MAGPQFDVKANVSGVTGPMRDVGRAIDDTAKTADRANKKQYRPLAPGALQELREAHRLLKEMSTLSHQVTIGGGSGGAGHGGGQLAPTTPPRNAPSEPSNSGGRRGGRWSNYGQNTGWGRVAGAFTSGIGGATSTIAGEAMSGARSGGGGGFSAMGLLRGGLLGAGLFGAYKIGSAVSEGYDNAKTKAVDIDTLKRAMGDLGKSFSALQVAADYSAKGLGINSNEAAKLAIEYNKLSGGLKGPADIVSEIRNSVGFGRSYGIDPNQSGQFFASMRFMGGGDEKSSRRLALLIGETISRTGMNARASELISAIQAFASATNRNSLAVPNVEGYSGAFAGMMGLGIKGMTSDSAMSILSAANQSMMNMGAAGEAGQNFTLAALSKGGKLNPIQASILSEGGMFGTRGSAFGSGGAYAKYLQTQGIDIGTLGLGGGGQTNFEAVRSHLDTLGGGADLKLDAAKRYFGLSSYNQAAALMAMQPKKMGSLGRLLGRNNINVGDVNETGIATLGDIATADSKDDLMRVYSNLKARKGAGALSTDEMSRLETASGGDLESFRDAMVKVAASKDQEATEGNKMRQQMKDIETATTQVGEKLLKPMELVRDTLLVMANKGGANSIRAAAAAMEKADIDEEYKDRIKAADTLASYPGRWKSASDEHAKQRDALIQERDTRKASVDQRLKDEKSASSDLYSKLLSQESGGKHYGKDGQLLTSNKGAKGISQVMPKTGVKPGYGVTPLQNESEEEYRRFGKDYLDAMLKEFGGDKSKALAAYNAGPGAVKNAVAKYGDKWLSVLPAETQNYVASITGNYDQSTPLPAGSGAKPSAENKQVMTINGEFRLVDQSGRERASPVGIRKRLSVPRSEGISHGD